MRQRSGRYRSCAAARASCCNAELGELADALAADAEFGGEAVVGTLGSREGAQGEDQPPPFLQLAELTRL